MKLANANSLRAQFTQTLYTFFDGKGEDVGLIASNGFNFPVVTEDGEEGWVEIFVKVPKGTKDEEYDGYGRRESYSLSVKEKAEKEAEKAKSKAKKIAKDKARREKAEG